MVAYQIGMAGVLRVAIRVGQKKLFFEIQKKWVL